MKKVGITSAFDFDANYLFKGYPRLMLNFDYVRSVEKAGAVPFVLPITADYEVAKQQVAMLDGVILSGGQDVNSLLYGQEPHALQNGISKERDTFEYLIIRAALELNKPIFGICRGSQILNVYFGGTIFQDNSLKEGSYMRHVQVGNPSVPTHSVQIVEDSILAKAIGKTETTINTFHHQSLDKIADHFRVVAVAPDGIVEAIEAKSGTPIFATQWHPEMLSIASEEMQNVFNYFVEKII